MKQSIFVESNNTSVIRPKQLSTLLPMFVVSIKLANVTTIIYAFAFG